MTPIQTNKPVFFNSSGEPLNGTIYIGQPDADPRTSPKTVTFRDSGGSTFTASQPLTTINGRITYNGKPIVALVDGEYSMLVFDSAGAQVDYARSVNEGGTTGGGIGDFSEVTRVGLTLSEVKAFDVSVGEVVENVGLTTATDSKGSRWLAISSTGSPGDDQGLIDFDNGLQGRRLAHGGVNVWSDPAGVTSVPMTDLSSQGPGHYILAIEGTGGDYALSIFIHNESENCYGSAKVNANSSSISVDSASYFSGIFRITNYLYNGGAGSGGFSVTFHAIYKV